MKSFSPDNSFIISFPQPTEGEPALPYGAAPDFASQVNLEHPFPRDISFLEVAHSTLGGTVRCCSISPVPALSWDLKGRYLIKSSSSSLPPQ